MLEIRNLTKVYKTKGGADTKALDDVSIRFEEKGLVFLLGKSGSGKSTLLNLAGGLDEPTSGEVVVMGKSSREFSGSDFDSYRNTYVGFVFQEYNVLNEFNVEDNIALALELQGKPKNKQKIAELLRDVDLEQYAKRKPNTLSGGQKQRIAIARALIKDPQIIMADEPTGALDSATGKQVFDTLKKLSETRLVIVVSHDREFAEIYGDRIVELRDGKIISDVTKVKAPAVRLSENVTKIGDNTLSIKSGATLTQDNLREIQRFVSSASGNVIISKGQSEIAGFKKANRIDDNGARERFDDTQEDKLDIKTYERGDAKFIRSRLPARKAIKIGASGLKLKPFRLVITVLLSLIAFIMFGLFSTMMFYDGDAVRKSSFLKGDYNYLTLEKRYHVRQTYTFPDGTVDIWDNYYNYAYFTPAEKAQFEGAFGAYSLNGSASVGNVSITGDKSSYYNATVYTAAVPDEGNPIRENLIYGTYPATANEICISSYLFDCIKNGSFRPMDKDGKTEDVISVNSANQVVGTYLSLSGLNLKVTGIFNSGDLPPQYDVLKESSDKGNLAYNFSQYLRASLHTCILVTEDFYQKNYGSSNWNKPYVQYFDYTSKQIELQTETNEHLYGTSQVQVYGKTENMLPVTFFGSAQTLADNEIVLSLFAMNSFVNNYAQKAANETGELIEQKYKESNDKYEESQNLEIAIRNEQNSANPDNDRIAQLQEELTTVQNEINALDDEIWQLQNEQNECYNIPNYFDRWVQTVNYRIVYEQDEKTDNWTERDATAEEIAEARANILDILQKCDMTAECNVDGFPYGTYTVVGYYDGISNGNEYSGIYCSQSLYDLAEVYNDGGTEQSVTKYVPEEDAVYNYLYVPFDRTETSYDKIFVFLGQENLNTATDVWYYLNNPLNDSVEMANEMVKMLSQVFLWVGVVMALFAALLLFNFISMSISNKKKDIGILRAVGARGIDVFKIFFAESGIIVGLCALLSIVGTFVLVGVINNILKAQIALQVTLFVFGWISVVMMVGVALVVALIATFLPVYFAARKKPVESIRAL